MSTDTHAPEPTPAGTTAAGYGPPPSSNQTLLYAVLAIAVVLAVIGWWLDLSNRSALHASQGHANDLQAQVAAGRYTGPSAEIHA